MCSSASKSYQVHEFKEGGGVSVGMFNEDKSIKEFAICCLRYAVDNKMSLYFSTKNTVLKAYDGRFKDIFAEVYAQQFEQEFKRLGIQ